MECSICCTDFNLTTRKKIQCPIKTCQNNICKKCIENWLNERLNITCPCCNTIWEYQYSYINLGPLFMDKFKKIHKKIIFLKECDFLPQTQNYFEYEKYALKLMQDVKEYDKHIEKYSKMKKKDLKNDDYLKELDINLETKKEIIHFFKSNKISNLSRVQRLAYTLITGHIQDFDIEIQKIQKVKTICPCPSNQCKGFIKNNDHKCGICTCEICNKCHGILVESSIHSCKQDDIESVKTISKETKPCPKCSIRIFKIDGCDQMYCIECKTAFSWKTGQIEKGKIHNPHYYDELRKLNNGEIPRDPDDNALNDYNIEDENDLPIFHVYHRFYKEKLIDNNNKFIDMYFILNKLYMLYNQLVRLHFHNIATLRYYNYTEYDFYSNFNERFNYMKGKIDEDVFIEIIYKKNRKTDFYKEIKTQMNDYNLKIYLFLIEFYSILHDVYEFSKSMKSDDFIKKCNDLLPTLKIICKNIYDIQENCKCNIALINKVYGRKRLFDFEFNNIPKDNYLIN